jgi:mRNA-degrading endonuclease toxin of MazEF toxin-antitoxin module
MKRSVSIPEDDMAWLLRADRTGLRKDSKAQAEQIRAIAVERVGDRIGLVPYALLSKLEEAIRIHLDLGWAGTILRA